MEYYYCKIVNILLLLSAKFVKKEKNKTFIAEGFI